MTSDNISSQSGIDYSKLQDLLAAGRWEEADYETYLTMLKVVGRQEGDWIRPDEMKHFPSSDLLKINDLWIQYSDGKFGFSVQKQIYDHIRSSFQAIGSDPEPGLQQEKLSTLFSDESVEFVNRVGWQVDRYKDLTFDLEQAPKGHLPGCWAFRFFGFGWHVLSRKDL